MEDYIRKLACPLLLSKLIKESDVEDLIKQHNSKLMAFTSLEKMIIDIPILICLPMEKSALKKLFETLKIEDSVTKDYYSLKNDDMLPEFSKPYLIYNVNLRERKNCHTSVVYRKSLVKEIAENNHQHPIGVYAALTLIQILCLLIQYNNVLTLYCRGMQIGSTVYKDNGKILNLHIFRIGIGVDEVIKIDNTKDYFYDPDWIIAKGFTLF